VYNHKRAVIKKNVKELASGRFESSVLQEKQFLWPGKLTRFGT